MTFQSSSLRPPESVAIAVEKSNIYSDRQMECLKNLQFFKSYDIIIIFVWLHFVESNTIYLFYIFV